MAHFMSGRIRQNHVQRGPSWSELGRQMTMGEETGGSACEDPGRWVARANGERFFLPAQPDLEPEQQPQIRAPAGTWVTQAGGARTFVPSAALADPAERAWQGSSSLIAAGPTASTSRIEWRHTQGPMGSRTGDTRPTAPSSTTTSTGAIRNPNQVRIVAPPGWEPFAKRFVFACIATHTMLEFAE